jgi:hypothetical protein
VSPQSTAFVNSTKAVAKILFTQDDGDTFVCSGTLLNDLSSSGTPYFFTANHCINSATAARTMNTFWFFDAVSCGDHVSIPNYVQQATGATLLARSEDWDWALVRLVAPPPPGAFFAAWRAEPVAAGATVSVVHHPGGDPQEMVAGHLARLRVLHGRVQLHRGDVLARHYGERLQRRGIVYVQRRRRLLRSPRRSCSAAKQHARIRGASTSIPGSTTCCR